MPKDLTREDIDLIAQILFLHNFRPDVPAAEAQRAANLRERILQGAR